MTNPNEDTQPNTLQYRVRSVLRTANAVADPVIDRLLLRVVASGWSPVAVLAFALACIAFGVWIGAKP